MKIFLIYLSAFVLASLVGCANKLRPDSSSLSAIDANFPAAEFEACGKLWHGLGVCAIEEGRPLEDLGFKIQGYYQGSVRVDSADCSVDGVYSYNDNSKIENIVSGSASKSCVITFTVSPEYPKQDKQDLVVSGFRGHLRIKVVKPKTATALYVFRQPQTFKKMWKINVHEKNPVMFYTRGCGNSTDIELTPDKDGFIEYPLEKILSGKMQTCVIEAVVQSKIYKDLVISALVSSYADVFTPLPIPVLDFKQGKLTLGIDADPATSVLSVGNEYKFGYQETFKLPDSEKKIVRVLTVKGRSVLGIFDPSTGGVQWILR